MVVLASGACPVVVLDDFEPNMTGTGRFARQTTRMDLIELARTFQADRSREIEASTRRRRLLQRPVTRAIPTEGNPAGPSSRTGTTGHSVATSPSIR